MNREQRSILFFLVIEETHAPFMLCGILDHFCLEFREGNIKNTVWLLFYFIFFLETNISKLLIVQ